MRMTYIVSTFVLTCSTINPASAEYICGGPDDVPQTPGKWEIFLLHKNNATFREYDSDCDGELNAAELREFTETEKFKVSDGVADAMELVAAGTPPEIDKEGNTIPELVGPMAPDKLDPRSPARFLLRSDYDDIGIFRDPRGLKSVSGADFSWNRDGIKENDSFNMSGVASIVFSNTYKNKIPGDPYFLGYALAPSVLFNRLINTNEKLRDSDIDILSLGINGEMAFGDVLGGSQYIKARANYNTNFEGDPRSWSVTGEWRPIIPTKEGPIAIGAPKSLGPVTWSLDPSARIQYTESMEKSDLPLFVNADELLRVGPSVTLSIRPIALESLTPKWLHGASLVVNYSWLYDTYRGGDYEYFKSAINFPLLASEHVGLKLSYEKGQTEETGQRVDLAKIGLSFKW